MVRGPQSDVSQPQEIPPSGGGDSLNRLDSPERRALSTVEIATQTYTIWWRSEIMPHLESWDERLAWIHDHEPLIAQ